MVEPRASGSTTNVFNARRDLKRTRRRHHDDEELAAMVESLKTARQALKTAIAKAKAKAWEVFVGTLDENPWGRPYLLVRDKLRHWAPPFTESLETPVLEEVLRGLFPPSEEADSWIEPPLAQTGWSAWKQELEVTDEELLQARKRMLQKNAAPG